MWQGQCVVEQDDKLCLDQGTREKMVQKDLYLVEQHHDEMADQL